MVRPLLTRVFASIDRAGIVYCVLRDADRLDDLERGGEIDVLVLPGHLPLISRILTEHGFVRLPAWGYAPHHFFVYYDIALDCWMKLDVITEIQAGRRLRVFRTPLGTDCLAYRRRVEELYVPSPEDELVALVLHCVLDKGEFTPGRRRRAADLVGRVERARYLAEQIARYWPGLSWPWMSSAMARGDCDAVLATRPMVMDALARRYSRIPIAALMKARAVRKVGRYIRLVRPYAPGIALLAPDGAGKSTIAGELRAHLFCPVESVYMGLYPGRAASTRRLRLPGGSALRLLALQWARYLRARAHRAHGRAVVFDRYTYDALLPSTNVSTSRLTRTRRWILARACPAPDLVVILDAPGELLFARKPEHTARRLEQQRQAYLHLHSVLPSSVVIDATRRPEQVRRAVTALIWNQFQKRLAHSPNH